MQKGVRNMSIGYIPKKLKYARRQKRLRKKYKNFSCLTCRSADLWCSERHKRTARRASNDKNVENCKYWKPSLEMKQEPKQTSVISDKKKRKGVFSRIFK
jgi:hypothetical protein